MAMRGFHPRPRVAARRCLVSFLRGFAKRRRLVNRRELFARPDTIAQKPEKKSLTTKSPVGFRINRTPSTLSPPLSLQKTPVKWRVVGKSTVGFIVDLPMLLFRWESHI